MVQAKRLSRTAVSSQPPGILVVDDDRLTLFAISRELAKAGYRVSEAATAREALTRIDQDPPRLVLLDRMLPDASGLDVCRALRQTPATASLPIVIITATKDGGVVEQAIEAGASELITKPIDWASLLERIRFWISGASAADALRRELGHAQHAQHLAHLGYWTYDLGTRTLSCSAELCRLLGLAAESRPRTPEDIIERVHPDERDVFSHALKWGIEEGEGFRLEYRVIRPNGEHRRVRHAAEIETEGNGQARWLVNAVQAINTESAATRASIDHLATHDPLTGLPTRGLLNKFVGQAMTRAEEEGTLCAVLLIDIDGLSEINRDLGLSGGDLLLKALAKRLFTLPRTQYTVARYGGDVFAVLIEGIRDVGETDKYVRHVREAMRAFYSLQGRDINITTSMGVSVYPLHPGPRDALLRDAEAALFKAKGNGPNQCYYYEEQINSLSQERLALEIQLRYAIECDDLRVFYQPQVDVNTGRLVGVEALARWNHPTKGLINPGRFLPLAEENGLILDIGERVLRTACEDVRRWRRAGSPLHVSINLTARQLNQDSLLDQVVALTSWPDLPPTAVELEITEAVAMSPDEDSVARLQTLRQRGTRVVIDNFGTGQASLRSLQRLPIDRIKIDRLLTKTAQGTEREQGLLRALIDMGHAIGLGVTAEGVETPQQHCFLRHYGCDAMQGYYISPPLSQDDFQTFLKKAG